MYRVTGAIPVATVIPHCRIVRYTTDNHLLIYKMWGVKTLLHIATMCCTSASHFLFVRWGRPSHHLPRVFKPNRVYSIYPHFPWLLRTEFSIDFICSNHCSVLVGRRIKCLAHSASQNCIALEPQKICAMLRSFGAVVPHILSSIWI